MKQRTIKIALIRKGVLLFHQNLSTIYFFYLRFIASNISGDETQLKLQSRISFYAKDQNFIQTLYSLH